MTMDAHLLNIQNNIICNVYRIRLFCASSDCTLHKMSSSPTLFTLHTVKLSNLDAYALNQIIFILIFLWFMQNLLPNRTSSAFKNSHRKKAYCQKQTYFQNGRSLTNCSLCSCFVLRPLCKASECMCMLIVECLIECLSFLIASW